MFLDVNGIACRTGVIVFFFFFFFCVLQVSTKTSPKHEASAKRELLPGVGGGGGLPSNRLTGMCRWMGSHFHDWIDYNGVACSKELLEWGRIFSGFNFGVRIFWQVASLGIKTYRTICGTKMRVN